MFYHLLFPLRDYFFGFNVFRYITFRAAMASVTAFLICIVIGPRVIAALSALNMKQTIKRVGFEKLYEAHKGKAKTPTMGGILILGAVALSTLLWTDLTNRYALVCLSVLLWLGAVGFVDDSLKLRKKNSKGLTALNKLFGQIGAGLILGGALYLDAPHWSSVDVPFFKDL